MIELRRRLALLTTRERLHWLPLFPLGAITAVLEMMAGVVLFQLIVSLTAPGTAAPLGEVVAGWLPWAGDGVSTLALAVIATAVHLVRSAVILGASAYRAWCAGRIAGQLSRRLTAAYLRAPYAFLTRRNSAEMSQSLLTGVPAVVRLLDSLSTIATELLVVTGLLVLLLRMAIVETLVAAAIVGVVLQVFVRASRGLYYRFGTRHFELGERVQRRLQEAFGGVKELKVSGREAFFLARIAADQAARERIGFTLAGLEAVPRLLTEAAFVLAFLAFAIALDLRAVPPASVLPYLGVFAYAGFRMIPASHRLSLQVGLLRYGVAVSAALCHDADAIGVFPATTTRRPVRLTERLRFERVSFTHEASPAPILQDVSFEIAAGEFVAIVGETGAGKTTMVDLILGLRQPTAGRITVDGVSIEEDVAGWCRQIGYVPQDPLLLDDSLLRNIAFGIADEAIDREAVIEAARVAQLGPLLDSLPDGLDTIVGERGIRLSGGERQRVAIARALYHRPDVMVLDEATSSLDPATEDALARAIADVSQRKTLIVVAHRLTTMERADRVIVLQAGRVAATGTYRELARSCDVFQRVAALAVTPEVQPCSQT